MEHMNKAKKDVLEVRASSLAGNMHVFGCAEQGWEGGEWRVR